MDLRTTITSWGHDPSAVSAFHSGISSSMRHTLLESALHRSTSAQSAAQMAVRQQVQAPADHTLVSSSLSAPLTNSGVLAYCDK